MVLLFRIQTRCDSIVYTSGVRNSVGKLHACGLARHQFVFTSLSVQMCTLGMSSFVPCAFLTLYAGSSLSISVDFSPSVRNLDNLLAAWCFTPAR